MSVPYLLLARYKAIAEKNNYIILVFKGTVESFSETIANGISASALVIETSATSEANGEGNARLLHIFPLSADGEITSDTDVLLRTLDVKSMESDVLTESDIAGVINLFKVLSLNSDVEHESDTEATGGVFQAVVMDAEDVSMKLAVSKPTATLVRICPMSAENVEIKHYTDATAYSYKFVVIPQSIAESNTYTDAVARLLKVLSMLGETGTESFGSAIGHTLNVLPFDGETDEYTNAIASITTLAVNIVNGLSNDTSNALGDLGVYDAKSCEVHEKNNTETIANMKLWVLPVVWSDTLLLHQAVSATQTDNTLEVM